MESRRYSYLPKVKGAKALGETTIVITKSTGSYMSPNECYAILPDGNTLQSGDYGEKGLLRDVKKQYIEKLSNQ